jgi:PKD domain
VGPPIARPWIELFESTASHGRYVVIDQLDRFKDNFDDFRQLDRATLFDLFIRFSNRAASWRWFAPVTCAIRANDEPISDSGFPGPQTRTLSGTGEVTVVDDLHTVANDAGNANMFRAVSSAQLTSCANYYSAEMTSRWDLDFDGTAETVSNSAIVSATELNGPRTFAVRVEAQHPIDGRIATKIIPVTVRNVSPAITAWMLSVGPGRRLGTDDPFAIVNRPVTVSARFTDAGRFDHQTASIEWGDGSVSQSFDAFTDAFGGVEGRLEARHTYTTDGVYTVRLSVSDNDGGVGQTTATITVVTPPAH